MKKTTIIVLVLALIMGILNITLSKGIEAEDLTELVLIETYPAGTVFDGQNVMMHETEDSDMMGEVKLYQTRYWYDQVQAGYGNVEFSVSNQKVTIHADDNDMVLLVNDAIIIGYLYDADGENTNEIDSNIYSEKITYFIEY